jgi:hypothetical protein
MRKEVQEDQVSSQALAWQRRAMIDIDHQMLSEGTGKNDQSRSTSVCKVLDTSGHALIKQSIDLPHSFLAVHKNATFASA